MTLKKIKLIGKLIDLKIELNNADAKNKEDKINLSICEELGKTNKVFMK